MGDHVSQVMWPCTFTESAASDEGWGKKYIFGTVCKCVTEEQEEDYTIRSGRLGLKGCIGITLRDAVSARLHSIFEVWMKEYGYRLAAKARFLVSSYPCSKTICPAKRLAAILWGKLQ